MIYAAACLLKRFQDEHTQKPETGYGGQFGKPRQGVLAHGQGTRADDPEKAKAKLRDGFRILAIYRNGEDIVNTQAAKDEGLLLV